MSGATLLRLNQCSSQCLFRESSIPSFTWQSRFPASDLIQLVITLVITNGLCADLRILIAPSCHAVAMPPKSARFTGRYGRASRWSVPVVTGDTGHPHSTATDLKGL